MEVLPLTKQNLLQNKGRDMLFHPTITFITKQGKGYDNSRSMSNKICILLEVSENG